MKIYEPLKCWLEMAERGSAAQTITASILQYGDQGRRLGTFHIFIEQHQIETSASHSQLASTYCQMDTARPIRRAALQHF